MNILPLRKCTRLAAALSVVGTVQCARPGDTVLDCSAGDLRHLLQIRETERVALDLSSVPPARGDAEVSDTGYVLRFLESRDHYELRFRIDRATGRGTRELFDDEQQPIRGHGGTDEIACTSSAARP